MGSVGHRHRKGSLNADGRKIAEAVKLSGIGVSPVPSIVPVVDDGSLELKDRRKESYCQKIVQGVEQLEAYWQAFCDEEGIERSKRSTALGNRHKVGSSSEVIARIGYLNRVSEGASRISRSQKKNMLDDLLEKSFQKAMSEHASPKEVSVCLDVMARHDMMNGDINKPKVVIEFAGIDKILGDAAFAAIEKRLGIKHAEGEVIDAETVKGLEDLGAKKEKNGKINREAEPET
jgi:hypothetical protein